MEIKAAPFPQNYRDSQRSLRMKSLQNIEARRRNHGLEPQAEDGGRNSGRVGEEAFAAGEEISEERQPTRN